MLPPLCAWILANGQPCNQFALRRRQFCRAHDKLSRVEQSNLELRETLDLISTIDIQNLISLTRHTIEGVIRHSIAPGRAHTILEAARGRLDILLAGNVTDGTATDSPSSGPERQRLPKLDLSALASMVAELTRLNPMNSGQEKLKTSTNAMAAATSILTPAK